MKKVLKIIILFAMAFSILANCFIATAAVDEGFSDVKETAWYYEAVNYAVENGLMNGVGNGKFSPGGAASRAMLVTLLYRMEGEPKVSGETPFTDLKSKWYQDSICWAYQNKIVNGITETTYKPSAELTRQQFATILYRYTKDYLKMDVSSEAKLSDFPDGNLVSAYAKEAMAWAYGEGLITGSKKDGQTHLAPKGNATRAQMATIFQRFDQHLEEERAEQPAPEHPQPEQSQPEQPQPEQSQPEQPQIEHRWSVAVHKQDTAGAQSKHYYTCGDLGCNEVYIEPCMLTVSTVPATCKTHSKSTYFCAKCGYNETIENVSESLADHDWNATPFYMYEEDENETDFHYYTCKNNCGASKKEACTFTVSKTPAEFQKAGKIIYHCSLCKHTKSIPDPEAPALKNPPGYYKVISYNIKAMYYDYKTNNTVDQREGVVNYLKEQDADIIGLQEVDCNNPRSFNYDQMKYLSTELGYNYYYCDAMNYEDKGYQYGTGILSKYPIKDAKKVYYQAQDPRTDEKRAYSRVVIAFPEGDLVFYNTHLCPVSSEDPTKETGQQFNELMNAMYSETLPTVLTGDYNLLLEVRSRMVDHSKVTQLNGGKDQCFFTDGLPIDDIYIRNLDYYTDKDNCLSLWKDDHSEAPYSDHIPLWGYFKFK